MAKIVVLCLFVLAATARADDPSPEDEKKIYMAALALRTQKANDACGTKIKATYDWSAETEKAINLGIGPTLCSLAVKAIGETCTAGKKAAVGKKIKSVTCRFDASVVKKKSTKTGTATEPDGHPPVPHLWLELKDGVYDVRFDWNSVGVGDETTKYLGKAL